MGYRVDRGSSHDSRTRWLASLAVALLALVVPPNADAAPEPAPYGQNDFRGFRNILPPGQGQSVNALEIAGFLATGQRPPHDQDQLDMYSDLVYAAPGLTDTTLPNFFKDATFGVQAGDVERRYSPRSDVTIVRDGFSVPHIYGATRAGAMFGAGYVAAEDRMFFIDALRHAGRAELASFAGGSQGNREMDRSVWADTPYRESELRMQYELGDELYGAEGRQLQRDVDNYVAGINKWISEAKLDPTKMPGEYALLGHPLGPEPWTVSDVISVASLVAGIFGKGGGGEVGSALVLEEATNRFGQSEGLETWNDFRRAEDAEAPTTVHEGQFPYETVTPQAREHYADALPDPGTAQKQEVVVDSPGATSETTPVQSGELPDVGDLLGNLRGLEGGSNALLVPAKESETGRPLAVMGPQVSYFSPQILLEMDIHAPDGPTGPPIDARGTAFPGTNLYVQLGHGRDYAWSATSAGQDIIDTFAVKLCEPDGSSPSLNSMHYRFRGECLPIDVLEKTNAWTQSPGDPTPSGSETYRAERTALGIVTHRAMIDGQPVAYTKLRATYFHEVDGALGFADFNNPEKMESPDEFMAAACRIPYTFNWFYADNQHISYFNSGANPVRSELAHPDFPTPGEPEFEWKDWVAPSPDLLDGGALDPNNVDPRSNLSAQQSCAEHPQVTDQEFLTSWNNKQAHGTRAADDQWGYGPVYRSLRLDRRIEAGIEGEAKMSLPELVDAMEDAGTVDLRGQELVPVLLRVLDPDELPAGELRDALETLREWNASGAHRRDLDRDGTYEDAEAVRIMDAWWPRLVAAEFEPTLGKHLFDQVQTMIGLHDAPRAQGSAFQTGWYGYVDKDLRMLLAAHGGGEVNDSFSRVYCGGGELEACRARLLDSLADALAHSSDAELYPGQPDEDCAGLGDAQWCTDAVRHTTTGAITPPPIHWIDRPTFQQAVEIQGHR